MVSNIKHSGGKNKFRGPNTGKPVNETENGQGELGIHEEADVVEETTAEFTQHLSEAIAEVAEEAVETEKVIEQEPALIAQVEPESTQPLPEVVAETAAEIVEIVEITEATEQERNTVQANTEEAIHDVTEFKLTPQVQPAKAQREVTTISNFQVIRPPVNESSCVKAIEQSITLRKSALYLEVAVALAVFSSSVTGADRESKRTVLSIYGKAGFDTLATGKDYKTINRRINASVDLYNMLGREKVLSAMNGLRDSKAINLLCSHLGETYNFDSINSLLEFVGKPVVTNYIPISDEAKKEKISKRLGNIATSVDVNSRIEARREERQKQITEESDGILIFSGPMSLLVPRDCTPIEVRAFAAKLIEFAERMEAEIGTPEDQRNREMHS